MRELSAVSLSKTKDSVFIYITETHDSGDDVKIYIGAENGTRG